MPRLWLAENADATMRNEAKTRRLVETGGPLFGYIDPTSSDCVIAIAYGPGPGARHRVRSLIPDRVATQRAIWEVHSRSHGAFSYIGEWHTHPGGTARPSQRYVDTLATIASEPPVDVPEPIMVIVPTVILSRRIGIREPSAYRWLAATGAIQRLDISATKDISPPLGGLRRRATRDRL